MNISHRPRRNRKNPMIQKMVQETSLQVSDLIYPLFIHDSDSNESIQSMPGCMRWSLDGLVEEALDAHRLGVPAVVLFPAIKDSLKTPLAEECYNPEGLVPAVVRSLKAKIPTLQVITDVALDPYNSEGHDGIVREVDGEIQILNDETVEILCQQAVTQAKAGADIIAPSDMMDGRVAAIRAALDAEGFEHVSIMSYTAKYASAFYGPFRGALDSSPKAGDKMTYQMNPANSREALRELAEDEAEGADIIMVKPAGPYLDIISKLRDATSLPIAAYQVSGEYLMIKSASNEGWVDERKVMIESLIGIKRAGADMILTYFAKEAARLLQSE